MRRGDILVSSVKGVEVGKYRDKNFNPRSSPSRLRDLADRNVRNHRGEAFHFM